MLARNPIWESLDLVDSTSQRMFAAYAKLRARGEVGERLRAARLRSGFDQDYVAEKLNVSVQTVRNWEAGRNEPSDNAKNSLAHLYDVPPAEFSVPLRQLEPRSFPLLKYNRVPADAEAMRDARRKAGLTQAQVAEQTGISKNAIGRYESGHANLSLDNLRKLASSYDTPAAALTTEEYSNIVAYLSIGDADLGETSPAAIQSQSTDEVMEAYSQAIARLSSADKTKIANFIRRVLQCRLERDEQIPTND